MTNPGAAANEARRPARVAVPAVLIVLLVHAGTLEGQVATGARLALIRAEDARGRGPEGIAPILDGLRDPALRETAIRALGRLEKPDLVGHLVPFLAQPAMRAVAAEAMAQSLRGIVGNPARGARERALVDSVLAMLRDAARAGRDPATRGAIARSIGRLPYDEPRQAREAEAVLVALERPNVDSLRTVPALEGIANGLYSLARARRALGDLAPGATSWLHGVASFGLGAPAAAPVRRLAWLALVAAGSIDAREVSGAISGDPDPQVRRLAVAALPNVQDTAFRREQLARVAGDPEPMVRLEWVRVYRLAMAATDCAPLLAALDDRSPHVRLAALDALGGPCPERDAVVAALRRAIDDGPAGETSRHPDGVSWHARAHALAALARIDASAARPLLRRDTRHPVWQVRMYVARGAAAIRDTALLTSLAYDPVGNVREAAIDGLSGTLGHVADLVYARALESPDYHVVLAAARALRGAPVRDSILPRVVGALERLSRERRQTSRDPRLELLARVREMGDRSLLARLQPLLADVDDGVAAEAARVANALAGEARFTAAPPAPPPPPPPVSLNPVTVRVTMAASSGGGSFDVQLDPATAPVTVARVVALIRERYYDGLTFHRVVPNFVLQGGSPGMNEYVGDGPFMRDELGLAHHARGTLGISTRGRDTGDAQWFINLVDNYRLDHDYTVFGTVVAGLDVVDRVLEGDVMESVRIRP